MNRVVGLSPVASADSDSGRWAQQPLLHLGAIRWRGARYNLALRIGKHHLGGQRTS